MKNFKALNIPDFHNGLATALVLACAIASGFFMFALYGLHDPSLLSGGNNVWFQGDLPRLYENMTQRFADGHYRVKVHPLHSLEAYPPVFAMRAIGIDSYKAIQIFSSSLATLWFIAAYLLFRSMGCRKMDALLISILGISSSAAVFWMSVPESYALGSISIIVCLAVSAYASRHDIPLWAYTAASSFSLSVTVTNWMVGLLATLTGNKWRRALTITLISLAVVTLLWGVEKFIFPNSVFFIGDREEERYLFYPGLERSMAVLSAFLSHTVIFPAIDILGDNGIGWNLLSIQAMAPGSSGILGIIGTIAWSLLLVLGFLSLFANKQLANLKVVLALSLLGQFSLHLLYGEETFLYSLHFLPLLMTLVALAAVSRYRLPTMALTAALIPLAIANNWLQFKEVNELAISPRHEVRKNIKSRPDDPWPRGTGHVVIANPGSLEVNKAYHEPGGGFSPGVGSFGVSVWMTNREGKLVATSDTIDIAEVSQDFKWRNGRTLPEIATRTRYYDAVWAKNEPNSWRLALSAIKDSSLSNSILFRSVGPAGGAIREMKWDGRELLINKRWIITADAAPAYVYLGDETSPAGINEKTARTESLSKTGWAFARFDYGGSTPVNITVRDSQLVENPWMGIAYKPNPVLADLQVDVPDKRFAQSLNSQISHLMMGIVKGETRPGEPTNYPLAWQRDGAYVLVALARAGKLDPARLLAKDLAERDFFGGFGPEADAPGLGIWSLLSAAEQIQDIDFYNWLWPHIKRKADYIETMRATKAKLYQKVVGPVVPKHSSYPDLSLVADPAHDGLIIGKMDNQRPLLFVNSVSYRGLIDAARLARKLNFVPEAIRWESAAREIKAAWEKSFTPPMSDNDRTYISALWPAWVATDVRNSLGMNLKARWLKKHTSDDNFINRPLWTYFEVAEAHQWLFLDNRQKVWATLNWFWANQSSPGLYSWWEGGGEENSFERWNSVRGWVDPRGVTPHYWTAAEMALLQIDMLGYIDHKASPELVIGNGVPPAWINESMNIRGLRVDGLLVDWQWNDNAMTISIKGTDKINVRLGGSFPADAKIDIRYLDT